ncbi:hypothetical protein [Spongiactinospora sp. TRM90649]|uniref:hypothetical protein n=1 Tax=Spongiactinospora sp. TRM90649 TaxID=3031114 RepID=UPI0023F8ED74|nr:hypothetical protein [Spongiactinospora sp. TRM90649]MDF5756919.1 hypothetical protein [Spongiactinospora sp. TRM90649]
MAGAYRHAGLGELSGLVKGMDSVELRLAVCEGRREPAISMLDVDPLDAGIRQVYFFDTSEMSLERHGMTVCAREDRDGGSDGDGDSIMKLTAASPGEMPADADFGVEAMPGGYVCSGAIRSRPRNARIKAVVRGDEPVHSLFTWRQREFFAAHAPEGVALDRLSALGPVPVLELGLRPAELARSLALELWNYPEDPRLLEVSTRVAPEEMVAATARTSAFLRGKGLSVEGGAEIPQAVPAVPPFTRLG